MKKEFVSYEIALELKQLGFDEPCLTYYFSDGVFNDAAEEDYTLHPGDPRFHSDTNSSLAEYLENELKYKAVAAPTFSQAFRWFRENHKLHQVVLADEKGKYDIIVGERISGSCLGQYETYEEAELECLVKLIEIVKERKS